jgi:hypothetical protein
MATSGAYARQLKALLPQGVAWNLEPDSMVSRVMLALAEELARIDGRAAALIQEIDPRTTLELLPDWERMLALPDICAPAAQTLQERRAACAKKSPPKRARLARERNPYGEVGCLRGGRITLRPYFGHCKAFALFRCMVR